MHLTIKDTAKMRRMGYTVKAMYETAKGIPFLKYFMDKAEMDRFTANAEEEGSRLVAWAERGAGRKGCLKDEEILHCLWK